jgi:hypothetical protein
MPCLRQLPPFCPLLVQKKFNFQAGEHQTGMNYTCRAFASNEAGAGPRSAPFTFTISG